MGRSVTVLRCHYVLKDSKTRQVFYYNVTFGRVRTIAVEKQKVLHNLSVCVYSLIYPACEAHAPCYIVVSSLAVSAAAFHIILLMARFSEKRYCI